MNVSGKRVFKTLALAAACALALGAFSANLHAAPAAATEKAQTWSVSGGTVGVRWNRDLAGDLGMVLGAASSKRAPVAGSEHEYFDLRQGGSLDFDVRNNNLRSFLGGALQASGGYVIDSPAGRIDLTNFRMVPRLGDKLILDIVSADGKAWFYVDRLMYELIDGKQRLAVRTMDLRMTPELATRLGQPETAGWTVGELELTADVVRQGALPQVLGSTKWHGNAVPGVPGATYQADLFMSTFSMQYSRCNGCTGVGGNGSAVFTPSSTLRNNVNNGTLAPTVSGDPLGTSTALYAADIPWYSKFTGNFPPYNNDQHPYLIWNLYRFNADGTIDQIGRSGAKHAFLTLNTSCLDNPNDDHILGRGCSDVYSVSNNDSSPHLGPRSEIIAASNIWGRCGSIYDTNCDGVMNTGPNGSFDQRLQVRESQFSGTGQTGATYMFESWYLARQDINILNSMATVRATFTRSGSVWIVGGNDQYKLGPAIDRWVSPTAPGPNERSAEVVTPEGRVKVAVKATSLGGGQWRYDYAVMNLDFARAKTQGAEPNLRVISNYGFDRINVPIGTATIGNPVFSDGDLDATNDWALSTFNGNLIWTSISRTNALNWGTMFRYSFTTDRAPVSSPVYLHIAAVDARETLAVPGLLAPGAAALRKAEATTVPVSKAR